MATGNIFLYRMGAGLAGRVSREHANKTEPQTISVTNPPLAFGDPVKIGPDGNVQALAAGDTVASVYGFLVMPYPTQNTGTFLQQGFGNQTPVPGQRCGIMRSGYISVAVQGTAAAANAGQVFIRIGGTVPAGGHIGGLEASADATAANSIALPLPNTAFKGAADSNGISEISYNI